MPFVLDCSVALAWALPDEGASAADSVLDRLVQDMAVVPPIWPLEVGNVLLVALKRGRIPRSDFLQIVRRLKELPVLIDDDSTEHALSGTIELADQFSLTTYDAAYLELARRRSLPLATLDDRLRKACVSAGVAALPT
ncbi:MAG: type II toxin-antitoxin system VapC family toxin [bacterium]